MSIRPRHLVASFLAGSAALFLSACVGGNVRQSELARYDLGALPVNTETSALPLAVVDIEARPWLVSNAMQYRLSYQNDSRRYSYADSQWVTPPAELMERHLTRRLVFANTELQATNLKNAPTVQNITTHAKHGTACRLRLGVDEIVQNFDTPNSSQVLLEARATLLPARGEVALARRAFQIQVASPTADAAGGVQATRDAVQKLGQSLNVWLQELADQHRQQTMGEGNQARELCKAN